MAHDPGRNSVALPATSNASAPESKGFWCTRVRPSAPCLGVSVCVEGEGAPSTSIIMDAKMCALGLPLNGPHMQASVPCFPVTPTLDPNEVVRLCAGRMNGNGS